MIMFYVEGFERSTDDPGKEMEASVISTAIVESIVSSSVDMAEKKNVVVLQQEITSVEKQEEQKDEEKENTMDDQGM